MRLIRRIHQRWLDWRRERRIADLAACCAFEVAAGRPKLAKEAWHAMRREVLARSPEQRARMGRRFLSTLHPLEHERFLADCEERPGQ